MAWHYEEERKKMISWLAEMQEVRARLRVATCWLQRLIVQLLEPEPDHRPGSGEISYQLEEVSHQSG